MESLGDRILFLGDDCRFSALVLELSSCKGNCIFFSNKYFYGGDGVFRDIDVCDLDNHSVKPLTDYPVYNFGGKYCSWCNEDLTCLIWSYMSCRIINCYEFPGLVMYVHMILLAYSFSCKMLYNLRLESHSLKLRISIVTCLYMLVSDTLML